MANIERAAPANGALVERPAPPETAIGAVGTALSSQAVAQVRLAMEMAIMYPRNEDEARSKVEKACSRFAFAEKATYAYPRGTTTVTGPSIYLAKELAKSWRNIQFGHFTVAETQENRTIRCWAWDLESNTRNELDMTFAKLIYTRKEGWHPPDERDLLELTNRQGSKGVRNAILSLLPWDLVQDMANKARATVQTGIKEDPEKFRKAIIASFASIGIGGEELTHYVGFPLDQLGKQHSVILAELRAVYQRIHDGDATWAEVVADKWSKEGGEGAAPNSMKDLRTRIKEKADASAAEQADEAAPPPQGRKKGGSGPPGVST
jgi:hypothetical protein